MILASCSVQENIALWLWKSGVSARGAQSSGPTELCSSPCFCRRVGRWENGENLSSVCAYSRHAEGSMKQQATKRGDSSVRLESLTGVTH